MQRAVGYFRNVGLFDVLTLDAGKHFAIDAELPVGAVAGGGCVNTDPAHDSK